MRDVTRAQWEDKVVALTNIERRSRGLALLGRDERLRRSARRHSGDMARLRTLAHRLPRLPDPFERMEAEGFEHPGGENVAFGQESPARVVLAWMTSVPHRANIVHPDFDLIGVGLVVTADGHWWTQNFGYSPR
ncbi:CAP domain-containing protein [Actinosynnema sp. CA-299493]